MIEVTFKGSVNLIRDEMARYLDKDPDSVEDTPLITYKPVESSSDAPNDHTVTMFQSHPVACTCRWFRFHPNEKWCRHMKVARQEAIRERA